MTWATRLGLPLAAIGVLLGALAVDDSNSKAEGPSASYPRQVLLIRHGEKPADEELLAGLSPKGKDRAEALYHLFEKSNGRPTPFAKPDFIFAASNSKNSHRPVETVKPLAKRLKLPLNTNFGNDNFDQLARELFQNPKYAGKTILICWRHGSLPQLAGKFKATGLPMTWPDGVFDRVWQITYDGKDGAEFRDLPQHLLPKDSEK